MLDLINAERASAGVAPLVLGNNIAAQVHAEGSLEGCYSSIWSADGLKSEARYSLAGGYQANTIMVSGTDYCSPLNQASILFLVKDEIRDEVEDFLERSGFRENLIDEQYRKLNVGLAWDLFGSYTHVVLQLEGDFIEYDQLPAIENGILTLSGRVKNGINLDGGKELSATVFYNPPPQPLTAGQIARIYSADSGPRVAAIRRPPGKGRHYTENEYTRMYNPCPSPYDIAADAPAPGSRDEANDFYEAAKAKCLVIRADEEGGVEITVPRITASEWDVEGDAFAIAADLSEVVQRHGNGLYDVTVWGSLDGEDVVISEYVIFHGVTPPDSYYPN